MPDTPKPGAYPFLLMEDDGGPFSLHWTLRDMQARIDEMSVCAEWTAYKHVGGDDREMQPFKSWEDEVEP